MTTRPRPVLPWALAAAAAALVGAAAIPAVDGGEVSEGWWAATVGLAPVGVLLATLAVIAPARRRHGLAPSP